MPHRRDSPGGPGTPGRGLYNKPFNTPVPRLVWAPTQLLSAMTTTYILTLSCPDRTGIVHAVSGFLLERGGNIEEAAQYNDHDTGLFFMRVQFACGQVDGETLQAQWGTFAQTFEMKWDLHATTQPMRTVLMVSKEGHCLNDLLFRWKSGLLPLDIRAIVSNHREFYQLAASYNVPFHHIPVTAATKAQAEAKQYEIIQAEGAELVVLARYMQILSDDLCRKLAGRAINIHHSFLPSFKGAKPYYQAHDRGVKLIGATAHYVTADLDEGPIIEQDVARVDHSKTVEDLTTIGRDTESQVLARAVKWHSEHRVLINGHKTVIFR
ncbi:MAG: Formyltetrahydrofolate deformylase [Pseudomonadota bacterium]